MTTTPPEVDVAPPTTFGYLPPPPTSPTFVPALPAPAIAELPAIDIDAPWLGLNVGCGPFRAEGWLNVDVIHAPQLDPPIVPDMLGNLVDGLDLPAGRFPRIYLGHVLEHLDWSAVGTALDEARRLLAPRGEVVVVGPDVFRAIEQYKAGIVGFDVVEVCLEDAHSLRPRAEEWEGARHRWNCHSKRVFEALIECGFEDVVSIGVDHPMLDDGWPVVSRVRWQMGIVARVETPE